MACWLSEVDINLFSSWVLGIMVIFLPYYPLIARAGVRACNLSQNFLLKMDVVQRMAY